jgi:hypothetical protein
LKAQNKRTPKFEFAVEDALSLYFVGGGKLVLVSTMRVLLRHLILECHYRDWECQPSDSTNGPTHQWDRRQLFRGVIAEMFLFRFQKHSFCYLSKESGFGDTLDALLEALHYTLLTCSRSPLHHTLAYSVENG